MPSFKVNRDAIEATGDTPQDLAAAAAEARAAFDHIRATPAAPERLGPGFGFTGDRRTTPTVNPTPGRWGRPIAPAIAGHAADHTEAGMSWQAIADTLNAEQVPTVRGGAFWRVSSVQSAAGYVRPPARAKRVALPDAPRRRRAGIVQPRPLQEHTA